MNARHDIVCEWTGCEAPVAARVSFGYRLGEPEASPAMHELELCEPHIDEVRRYFLVVNEHPIGDDSPLKHAA